MNATKYVGSLLTAFSDAGSTPAASTITKPLIFSALEIQTEKSRQNCTVTVKWTFRFAPIQRFEQNLAEVGVEMLSVYTRHHPDCKNAGDKTWRRCNSPQMDLGILERQVHPPKRRPGREVKRCPHMFRDTFAVEMLLAGVPIDQVSLLLGHASVKITEKSYAPFVKARQLQLQESVRNAWKLGQSPGTGPEGGPPVVPVTENKHSGWQLIRSGKKTETVPNVEI